MGPFPETCYEEVSRPRGTSQADRGMPSARSKHSVCLAQGQPTRIPRVMDTPGGEAGRSRGLLPSSMTGPREGQRAQQGAPHRETTPLPLPRTSPLVGVGGLLSPRLYSHSAGLEPTCQVGGTGLLLPAQGRTRLPACGPQAWPPDGLAGGTDTVRAPSPSGSLEGRCQHQWALSPGPSP